MNKLEELLSKINERDNLERSIEELLASKDVTDFLHKLINRNDRLNPRTYGGLSQLFPIESVAVENGTIYFNDCYDNCLYCKVKWLLNTNLIEEDIVNILAQRELDNKNQQETNKENRRQRYLSLKKEFE